MGGHLTIATALILTLGFVAGCDRSPRWGFNHRINGGVGLTEWTGPIVWNRASFTGTPATQREYEIRVRARIEDADIGEYRLRTHWQVEGTYGEPVTLRTEYSSNIVDRRYRMVSVADFGSGTHDPPMLTILLGIVTETKAGHTGVYRIDGHYSPVDHWILFPGIPGSPTPAGDYTTASSRSALAEGETFGPQIFVHVRWASAIAPRSRDNSVPPRVPQLTVMEATAGNFSDPGTTWDVQIVPMDTPGEIQQVPVHNP